VFDGEAGNAIGGLLDLGDLMRGEEHRQLVAAGVRHQRIPRESAFTLRPAGQIERAARALLEVGAPARIERGGEADDLLHRHES
jgi:hypothetical protein